MVLKFVDGRSLNQRFWVFAGGLTDVQVVTTVVDTVARLAQDVSRTRWESPFPAHPGHRSLRGRQRPPKRIQALRRPRGRDGIAPDSRHSTLELGPRSSAGEAACTPDATTLCLNGGRFKIQAQWSTPQGQSGAGQAVSLTGDTGNFWFFSANNLEMVLKAVNGCAFNQKYWVFAGGLTNVNVVTTVTDTQTGAVKTYTNPQGTPFQPLQDTSAFNCQ